MTGLLKFAAYAVGAIILISIVLRIVHLVISAILSLLFPLLLVGLIAYLFYRLINHKCVANSHRIFH